MSTSPTPHLATGALKHIRVLDLSMDYAGALVAMGLADQGASVVRLDSPMAAESAFAHRGKVRITHAQDLGALLHTLMERADVIIEDCAAPLLRARALGEDAERGQIHCWVPAFPENHPEASTRGHEGIAQAYMGMHEVPLGRRPHYHDFSILSTTAAAHAQCGVVAALLARQRDGRGQCVEVSRAMTAYAIMELNAMFTVGAPKSWATLQWASTPFIEAYQAGDGEWIYVHAGLAAHVPRLLDVLEREAPRAARKLRARLSERTLADPTSVPGVREGRQIRALLGEIFSVRPAIVWERRLSRAGLCAQVARMPQAWREHDHARQSAQVITHEGRTQPGLSVTLSQDPGAPQASRHMDEASVLKLWPERAARALADEPVDLPPLHGVRVLDVTQVIAGPTATRTLAELGANVHRIENPHFGAPWVEAFHIAYNAGKTSETINLKATRGVRVLQDVLSSYQPDVVVQNFRPGAARKLSLDEDALRARFPELIYAHLTAYGSHGPWGDRPGWEQTAQAATGIQRTWGAQDGPDLFPLPFNDLCTGLHGALGVLLALFARQQGASGQRVETCLSMTATLMQAPTLFEGQQLVSGKGKDGLDPVRRYYMASDGWFLLCALDVANVWDIPGLERSRGASGQALALSLETELRRHTLQQWRERVEQAGLAQSVALIARRSQRAVLTDPDARERGLVLARHHEGVGEVTETKGALKLARTPLVALERAPMTEREREPPGVATWLMRQLAGAASLATQNR